MKIGLADNIASQMMKCGQPGELKATKTQLENFKQRHLIQMEWAVANLPTDGCRTSIIPAVIVKCLIKYDHQRVATFCKALKNGLFNGVDDPAYLLWQLIQKHRRAKGSNSVNVYFMTVCAAKAYMEGKTLQRLTPSNKDIFDWDEDFTVPDELLKNWHPDKVPS